MKAKYPPTWKPVDVNALLTTLTCGCAEFEYVIKDIKTMLSWCDDDIMARKHYDTLFESKGVFYLLAGYLGDFMEHGISARVSWLTPDGKILLSALNKFTVEEIEDSEGEAYDGCHY